MSRQLWLLTLLLALTEFAPAAGDSEISTAREPSPQPLILAHYMPWYTAKPSSDRWGWHWTMNHFDPEKSPGQRREIASHFYPLIGPYDSGDPHVLEYHLLLMKLSGIDGVIVDWYGLTSFRDYPVLHRNTTRLLQQCERLKMKFVICYEDQTIPALVSANRIASDGRVEHAVKEIEWLGKYWFQSPSYVRFKANPVLLSFGHAGLTNDEWQQCLEQLEIPVAYFSQDFRRAGAIGGFGWPAPKIGLPQTDRFLAESKRWPAAIPAAFPRFIDIYREAKVGDGYPKIPDDEGKTFEVTLEKALKSKPPIIQIATWNDWGEGTQIEPSTEFGYRDLKAVQTAVLTSDDANFEKRQAALTVPHRIFQWRQSDHVDQSAVDAIVKSLCEGNWDQAQSQTKTLQPK